MLDSVYENNDIDAICNIAIIYKDAVEATSSIKQNTSPVSQGVHPFLKKAYTHYSFIIWKLVNNVNKGLLLLFKRQGIHNEITNYRRTAIKIFDKIMFIKLNEYFHKHVINEQHGSLFDKSALTNLLIIH